MSTHVPITSRQQQRQYRWRLRLWFITALLTLVAVVFLIPLLWMVSSSLKPNYQIFAVPPQWIPRPPRWANYPEALTYVPFGRYALNRAVALAMRHIIGLSCIYCWRGC